MKKALLFVFAMVSTYTFAQPANDTCAMSQGILVVTAMANTYTADTTNATETMEGSCESPGFTDPDVWYNFTMPVNGNVRVSGITNNDYINVYDSCGGVEIACFFNNGFIYGLNGGQNYILKFARYNNGMGMYNFTLQAFEEVDNNECNDSETIVVSDMMANTYTASTIGATETQEGSCEDAGFIDPDVWFDFIMPIDGTLRVSNISSNDYINIYDSCGGTEIACFFGDESVFNLIGGQNYILKFARYNQGSGNYNFTVQAFEVPANDTCATSETITVSDTVTNTYTANTQGASETVEGSCETAGFTDPDVWYNFTMPINGSLEVSGITNNDYINIFDSCGGTEIDCFFGNGTVTGLFAGQDYILKFARYNEGNGLYDFTVQAVDEISNDECVDRLNITVETAQATFYISDLPGATESAQTGDCDDLGLPDLDVWYEFTMPVTGNVRLTSMGVFDVMTLYNSCDDTTEISCFQGSTGFFYTLTQGVTYVLRHSIRSASTYSSDFAIRAFEQAANDECGMPAPMTIDTATTTEYTSELRSASESTQTSGCDDPNLEDLDVWYEFTMPVTGNIRLTSIGTFDTMTLYNTCTDANEISCFQGGSGFFYSLVQGETYLLRHAIRSLSANNSNFFVQAFEQVANDECDDRTTILVETDNPNTYVSELSAATESIQTGNCDDPFLEDLDVWHEFNMPVEGNVLISSLGIFDDMTLYTSCDDTSEITCFSGSSGLLFSLDVGTYILRHSIRSQSASTSDFTIQAFVETDNNICSDAESIVVAEGTQTTVSQNMRGATESMDTSCDTENQTNLDAWYSFTMPVNGNIQISGADFRNSFALYFDCNSEEVSCFNSNGTFSNIPQGAGVVIQAAETTGGNLTLDFNIDIIAAPLSACAATTEYINGSWNNGDPDINTNAIIRSNYDTSTLGSFSACTLAIDAGVTLTIASQNFVEILSNITVDGILNVDHQGSVVQIGALSSTTNNGTINVNVTTPLLDPRDFMLMGSPMTNEMATSVFATAHQVREHDTNLFVPNADVAMEFPDAENFADDNGDDFILYNGLLSPGEGYFVQPQPNLQTGGSFNLVFNDGTLNNGDISIPVQFNTDKNSSPNILSNPYPSAIQADDLINANATVDEVYFWEHLTEPDPSLPGYNTANFSMEDISMYNLMGGVKASSDLSMNDTRPNGLIATAQGFGIKANAAGMVTFTNAMRSTSGNTTLRTAQPALDRERLWISITNEAYNLNANALIGFSSQTTSEYDASYDSRRLATFLGIYSHLPDGSQELGIQSREEFDVSQTINLGFSTQLETENATYTIRLNDIEGAQLSAATVYLLDNDTQVVTNLSEENYSFIGNEGTYNNRFVLYFEDKLLSNNSVNQSNIFNVLPNPSSDFVTITNANQVSIQQIVLIDQLGREVLTLTGNETATFMFSIDSLKVGVYIVNIQTESGITSKRLIKK